MQNIKISASSYRGCIRENNEDMLLIGDYFFRDGTQERQLSLEGIDRMMLALADGMGGHNCGEVASAETLKNLQFFYGDLPTGLDINGFNEALNEWLVSMNRLLEAMGKADNERKMMGTTLVALAYYQGQFYWMNCGDSRLYWFHDGQLHQLTADHSLNALTGEKKHSHIITNCIGGGCKTSFIDIVDCTEKVLPGDTFLLCSDGLSDMLADEQIETLLKQGADSMALCRAAEEAGGYDNVSVIVIHVA